MGHLWMPEMLPESPPIHFAPKSYNELCRNLGADAAAGERALEELKKLKGLDVLP